MVNGRRLEGPGMASPLEGQCTTSAQLRLHWLLANSSMGCGLQGGGAEVVVGKLGRRVIADLSGRSDTLS